MKWLNKNILWNCTPLFSFPFASSGSCPQGWIGHEGSCYTPFARGATWQEAEDTCRQLDSHLALSRSATENEFIAVEVGRPESRVWIGLRRIEGEFAWSDGKKADYTNWRRGEPKVASDCVSLLTEDIFQSWEVTNCDVMQAFICERGTKTVSFCWEKFKVYLECSPFKPAQVMCFHCKRRWSNCLTEACDSLEVRGDLWVIKNVSFSLDTYFHGFVSRKLWHPWHYEYGIVL